MAEFRWLAWVQRVREPVFVLNRHRRIVFVNEAWVRLTGVPRDAARRLACRRRRAPAEGEGAEAALEYLLSPPPEVLAGRPAGTVVPGWRAGGGPAAWVLDFWPFQGDGGLVMVLGRIAPVGLETSAGPFPLPPGALVLRARLRREHALEGLAGSGPALRRVAEQVRLAAAVRAPVLLTGEAGTGKEWVARAIHALGGEAAKPFVMLDCGRLPPAWAAGVVLGEAEPGARPDAGVYFLREPGRLPREWQARLAAFLAEPADAGRPRLLAACRADPAEEVRAGRLLEDLACRLSPLHIALPPLRQRREDLPRLVERLLPRVAAAVGKKVTGLNEAAWEVLRRHDWPGNVAELYRGLVTACSRATGEVLDRADLPMSLRLGLEGPRPASKPLPLKPLLEEAERRLIALALRRSGGNKSRAAELLGVWRQLLLRRMEALGLGGGGGEPEGSDAGPACEGG